jgi:hypothetical protein
MLILSACSVPTRSPIPRADLPTQTENGRVISGEEALELYGIDATNAAPTLTNIPTSEPWFPIQAWVAASVSAYEDAAPIRYLTVYSDPDLDLGGR